MIFLFALFFVVFGVITAAIAKRRGHDPVAWFLFGGFMFVIALPLAYFLKPKGRTHVSRNCPYCGASVGGERQCPKCNRGLPLINAATVGTWESTVARGDDIDKWAGNQPK